MAAEATQDVRLTLKRERKTWHPEYGYLVRYLVLYRGVEIGHIERDDIVHETSRWGERRLFRMPKWLLFNIDGTQIERALGYHTRTDALDALVLHYRRRGVA